jgi:pimeloyl-ACP methyl ester carboxylesterase
MNDVLIRKPKGTGPLPAILLVPGLGMTKHEWKGTFDEIAQKLVHEGFLTVQFAFDIFQKDGRIVEIPVYTRARYVEEMLRHVRALPDADPDRIGLIAQSYGVPTAAAADLAGVASVLFVSGVYFPYESFTRVWPTRGTVLQFDGETVRHHSDGQDTIVGKEFWTELRAFDQVALAKKLTMPVFMINGDQDKYAAKEDIDRVFGAIPGKMKKSKTFVGGDHGINEVPSPMREEFLHDVVEWFKETL